MQYSFFIFLASAAFTQGCSQEVSRLLGRKLYENASRYGKYGLLCSTLFLAPVPLIFSAKPDFLMQGVIKNYDELLAILQYVSPIMGAGIIADTVRYNLLQQLRSLGDLHAPTFISVAGLSAGMITGGILSLKTS